MSIRAEIATALAEAIPSARVLPYAKNLEGLTIGQPVLMVYVESATPGIVRGTRTNNVAVWVVGTRTDPTRTDDELEALLDAALTGLESIKSLIWTTAERQAPDDSVNAYKITATVQSQRSIP